MLTRPGSKYRPFAAVDLPDRRWPSRTLSAAPIWMSTDLRDGNQALFEPMDVARKLRLFHMLCRIGFREIEVGFPSASQTDFDFVRCLIEQGHLPDDVAVEVLAPAREPLIRRTMESLRGARRAIVHIYTATSPAFRDLVFGMSRREVLDMAVAAVRLVRELAAAQPQTRWQLEYSPETFSATELDYALEVCDAVTAAWGATPDDQVILNLPATVELATPNVYADQIEWMDRRLARREAVVLSVHPHNDRGTAVAAAELALMAGAQRVEGCLFGNGERTGNVDLVTLALNLYTQGVAPGLELSDINAIARLVEDCTRLPVHPRHPYAGDLVFTAFSGSHQDAIKKGFARQRPESQWSVPYLPVDPADLGRSYDSVIRVNSQSGKGGIAYLLETAYGVVLPRRLQVEFSACVQRETDQHGGELSAADLWSLFAATYFGAGAPLQYLEHQLFEHAGAQGVRLGVRLDGVTRVVSGEGNGPIDAAVHALRALGIELQVRSFEERSTGASREGGDATACAFVEVARPGSSEERYGVGMDANIVTASLKALLSGANRLRARTAAGAAQRAA